MKSPALARYAAVRRAVSSHTLSQWTTSIVLRILPDIMFVSIGLMVSEVGPTSLRYDKNRNTSAAVMIFRNEGFEFAAMIMLMAFMFQQSNNRLCLSRLLMESKLMRVIGYASYPIYVLHIVLINYYFRMIYDTITGKGKVEYSEHYGIQNEWIGTLPDYYFPITLGIVIVICFAVQKYFQDTFVASLWLRCLQHYSRKREHADVEHLNHISSPIR